VIVRSLHSFEVQYRIVRILLEQFEGDSGVALHSDWQPIECCPEAR
jgi:hypothetical protein